MSNERGLVEVALLKQRLDATFRRIESVDPDSQLQSDFAKYLCVLVSGYIEKAIAQLLQEHARRIGAPTLQSFVEAKTERFTNANSEKITKLLGSFDRRWQHQIKEYLTDEGAAAVNSIVQNRHLIVHGGVSGITYVSIRAYYEQAQRVVNRVQEICLGEDAM